MRVRGIGRAQRQARHVPLARAGLLSTQRRLLDGNENRTPQDGRMVDALALAAEEGRGHAAKCPGEALAASDPGISEWGNPPGARPGTQEQFWEGTGGTETSQYPEEQRGFP
jgi:hypothetical protein